MFKTSIPTTKKSPASTTAPPHDRFIGRNTLIVITHRSSCTNQPLIRVNKCIPVILLPSSDERQHGANDVIMESPDSRTSSFPTTKWPLRLRRKELYNTNIFRDIYRACLSMKVCQTLSNQLATSAWKLQKTRIFIITVGRVHNSDMNLMAS